MKPPIDHPRRLTCSKPNASITCAASSASFAMPKGCPSSAEPPMSRLLSRISSFDDASRSMKDGSQSALVAPKHSRPEAVGRLRFGDKRDERHRPRLSVLIPSHVIELRVDLEC